MAIRLESQLQEPERRDGVSHSLKHSWEQVYNQQEVACILERIQRAIQFDVYKCPHLYDLVYSGYQGDKDYYLEKGKEGKVLYLGMGTGRIFSSLSEKNPEAVGLDISHEMIDLFQKRNPLIVKEQIMQADALTANLDENQFDTIIAPYSFLQCFDDEDTTKLLGNIQKWLKPGGKFHTDTFSPYLIPFTKKGLESSVLPIDERVKIAIYVLYDHFSQKMKELALIEEEGKEDRVTEMSLHYYFPRELYAMMQKTGLDVLQIKGGYNGEPFDPTENEVIVYEARKSESSNGKHYGNGDKTSGNGQLHSGSKNRLPVWE